MTGAESIVFALRPLQEAGDPVLLPQRLHLAITTREELMRIALVADIPHELIAWRVEHVVERGRQLDDAESGADVAASPGADVDEPRPLLGAERLQLLAREAFQVGRRMNTIQKPCHR